MEKNRKTVLVTGASSGMGKEFALIFAEKGYDLILTARSTEKLEASAAEIRAKYGSEVSVIPADLTEKGASAKLYENVGERGLSVDVLINNAGFGDYGYFTVCDPEKLTSMIDLNCRALTEAAHYFGRDMMTRGNGKILNIASIAAFQPGPYMAVYFATKAYVLSLSVALNEEMKSHGVSVTALCPCPVRTGFEEAANLKTSTLFKKMKVENAHDMASAGYRALMKGKAVATYGIQSKAVNFASHIVTRSFLAKVAARINGRPES